MTIDQIEAQLSRLDTKLKPLGDGLYDETRPQKYASALDELEVRTEATRVMTAVAELYASTPELRDRIRDMFRRYRYVSWALWPSQEPTTPELFRLWLLVISMGDAGDDPRDMWLKVSRACKVAVSAGVDVGPILESIAAISSEQRQYRFQSMREIMLGTRISPRPPHRSRRALLAHRAPPSGFGVEAVTWQGV
jgi:hypothetical protein